MPLPMPRPISGKRFAPKMRMTIIRMMMSSGIPSLPIMVAPFATRRRLILSSTVLLLGCAGLSAQFSSGVNLVEVYAAVVDHTGSPVTGLTRGDFTILEDGQPQSLSAFAEGDFPLSVAVAIDRSFSTAKLLATEVS